jgi:predicted metal-dependent RNase
MNPITGNRRGKRKIPNDPGCIYALSSGMMTAKTTSNGFARGFINHAKNSLLFVGYADPDSPGGKIRASQAGDMIRLDEELPEVALNCEVQAYDFSGHAPRDQLLEFMLKTETKQTILVHGDPAASQWFANQLQDAVIPPSGTAIGM